MLWIALPLHAWDDPHRPSEAPLALSCWALGYTPRVAWLDGALALEVQASLRLFGGRQRLLQQIQQEAKDWPTLGMATAPTAWGAIALAHAPNQAHPGAWPTVLDRLPLTCLAATRAQATRLRLWGCATLGDVCRIPRDGLRRRLPPDVLQALDAAYGQTHPTFPWLTLPEQFDQTLEWADPVEHAQGLWFRAQRLLRSLEGWLRARQRGALEIQVIGRPDGPDPAPALALTVRCARPTRDASAWSKLLGEHLQRATLQTPVTRLQLVLQRWSPWPNDSGDLLSHPTPPGAMDWPQLVERLSARLGPQQVQVGRLLDDPRPLHGQQWMPAMDHISPTTGQSVTTPTRPGAQWEPTWLFDPPWAAPSGGEALDTPQQQASHWWTDQPEHQRLQSVDHPQHGLLWVRQGPPSASGAPEVLGCHG